MSVSKKSAKSTVKPTTNKTVKTQKSALQGIKFDDSEYELVTTSVETEQKKEAFDVMDDLRNAHSTKEVHDANTNLIFLFDCSSSMSWGIPKEAMKYSYLWPDEKIEELRALYIPMLAELHVELADLKLDAAKYKRGTDERDDADDAVTSKEDEIADLANVSQMGKESIVNLWVEKNLRPDNFIPVRNDLAAKSHMTKMEAVVLAAKKFVADRFEKYSNALVSVFMFNTETRSLVSGKSKDVTLAKIAAIGYPAGGTDIPLAVRKAIDASKPLGTGRAHHVVLITDGECSTSNEIEQTMMPEITALGMVIDLIHIVNQSTEGIQEKKEWQMSEPVQSLQRVCKVTGGEYVMIDNISDFMKTFDTASSRLCLPAGGVPNFPDFSSNRTEKVKVAR